jgi:hypothetical protein
MIRLSAIVATGLVFATAAFAQTNVPPGQSLCALGYEKAKDDSRMNNKDSEAYKKADKNNDGMIDKAEFDTACADRIFKEQDKAN